MRRSFNSAEKQALILAAGGKCVSCGVELTALNFHGDHVVPFAAGGPTDVANGQALCDDCNGSKSDRDESGLRDWQRKALLAFRSVAKLNFLAVATPGAGKTRFALECAKREIAIGAARRLVIVVPTTPLKKQWADAASKLGMNLDPTLTNDGGIEPGDMDGAVVTYAQVAKAPQVHRLHVSKHATFAVFDEVHHAGDALSWGQSLKTGFDGAVRRLCLSGTPFRGDSSKIPFVEYDPSEIDGTTVYRCRPDFSYGYGKALLDGVCRQVIFPSFEGRVVMFMEGRTSEMTFADELDEEQANRRLRNFLHDSAVVETMVSDADAMLSMVRTQGHPDAAGLLLAIDQEHAARAATIVARVSGETPTVVVSDDADAKTRLDDFRDSRRRWIVAVKMVSEGVDIPRLRVGVYATNVTSELFFRQAVGRFVRSQDEIDGDQSAYLFIPKDPRIVELAQAIKIERDHALRIESEELKRERDTGERQSTFDLSLGAEAFADDVIHDGEAFTRAELDDARRKAASVGLIADPVYVARLLRVEKAEAPRAEKSAVPTEPKYQRRKRLRNACHKRVGRLSALTGREHWEINEDLNGETGASAPKASVEQLERRLELIEQWIREAEDAS